MGYSGKLELKDLAIKLRKKGYSYNQIIKRVNVSKDTVGRWCKDIELTEKQLEKLLKRKLKGGEKGRLIASIQKKNETKKKILNSINEGKKDVGKLTKRDKFLIGIALYAGEGGKKSLEFANSDPKIIKFMIDWFREFCNVPESKFRGAIWIHDNLDHAKAIKYWSNLTAIPKNQFHKTYIAKNKSKSNKIRKNIHSYGVFSIRVTDANLHRKIMGWMVGILNT